MSNPFVSCIREYKKDTILTPVYVLVETSLDVIIPSLMAALIDYGINVKNMSYVLKMGGVLFICALLALVFGTLAGRSAAIASAGYAKNLRHDMYHHVQTYSFSNIDKFSTASLVTRLTTDVANVQNAFQMLIRLAIRSPIMLVFCLIFSFRIDVKLSLIFVGAIPILGVVLWYIAVTVHPIFQRVFKTYDKLNSVVEENLRGIRVVKSFTREGHEESKFKRISLLIFQDFSKAEKMLAFNMPTMQFCMYGCMLLISWFGAKAIVLSGNNPVSGLSTGEYMGLITYSMQILMSLMMLSMVFVMLIISRASFERISAVLNEKSDLTNIDKPVTALKDGSIRFDHVSFTYARKADKPVLDDVSLSIESGETVGILGSTGSSKTSLVQLIPRLYDVTGGSVLVGGVDVRNYDIETLRNAVAMVLQKNILFSGTIADNLRWGDESATDEALVQSCRYAQADGFVNEFPEKYDTFIDQGGSNVSGGQKQRLCIARALLKHPKILILDDSTSAVDTKTDALIRRSFKEELPETTKIIIAQRVASVKDADKIVMMDDGKIAAVGNHDQLMETSDIYREIYESQNKGGALHE